MSPLQPLTHTLSLSFSQAHGTWSALVSALSLAASLSHRAALSPSSPHHIHAILLSAPPAPHPSFGLCLVHKYTQPHADTLYLSVCLPHTRNNLSDGKWERVSGLMEAVILSPVTEAFHRAPPAPSLPCPSPSPRDRAEPEAQLIPHLWRGRGGGRGLQPSTEKEQKMGFIFAAHPPPPLCLQLLREQLCGEPGGREGICI